jgi:gamma-glutamylcyclotransferase
MFYFAYGSNMSVKRLHTRVPSAIEVGVGTLTNHTLRFHKRSFKDGSAKCDVMDTSNPGDVVYGVIYNIDVAQIAILDRLEGLGYGYEQKSVLIETQGSKSLQAFTYYAAPLAIDSSLKPFDWYKQHVLIGAREHDLPSEYIRAITAIESIADPDLDRQANELAIYS